MGALSLIGVETLQHECPYSQIVVLTAVEDEDALLQALKQGARGYLVKGISGHELKNVVRAIGRGETYVSPSMAGRLLKELTTTEERSATMGVASLSFQAGAPGVYKIICTVHQPAMTSELVVLPRD